jgi:hypothetical protein
MAGIAALLAHAIVSFVMIRRQTRGAVHLDENIYECDRIASPFVIGIARPKIMIPFRLPEFEKMYILRHEKHHIRRLDHLARASAYLLTIIYWFNPLVWIAYRLMGHDMEMSCDENVLGSIGLDIRKEYSRSLLSMAARRNTRIPGILGINSPLAFGESGIRRRVKNVLDFKKPGIWLILGAVLVSIAAIIVCAANPAVKKELKAEDLYGQYEFDENIYTNLLSSFLAVKGTMPRYVIAADSFQIIYQDGTIESFSVEYEKKLIDIGTFYEHFMGGLGVPDLSGYKKCYQYAVFTGEFRQYRLYAMDQAIWLADWRNDEKIWTIYRLQKSLLPVSIPSAATTGAATAADGYTLILCDGDGTQHPFNVYDDESVQQMQDIVYESYTRSTAGPGVNMDEVGTYIKFCRIGESANQVFYAFYHEAVSDWPQLQTGADENAHMRTDLPMTSYKTLYAIWENHLGDQVTISVVSGSNKVIADIYKAHNPIRLNDIKESLPYLTIDPEHPDFGPFSIYRDDEEQYGRYRMFDAETLEELTVVTPSGLKPQTFLLRYAKPGGRYIIEFTTGYWAYDEIYGTKAIFGIIAPAKS